VRKGIEEERNAMRRRIARIGVLCLVLTLCLATAAVGYGQWSKTLIIDGTVNTGNIDCVFSDASSDDPPTPDPGSNDPSADWNLEEVPPGSGNWEWVKVPGSEYITGWDIAETLVDPLSIGTKILTVQIADAWACYTPTVSFDITNNGTVPVRISAITYVSEPALVPWDCDGDGTIEPGEEVPPVTVEVEGIAVGDEIDGGATNTAGKLVIHMTDAAVPGSPYFVSLTIEVVNWKAVLP
jgi:hypothetical protein